VNRHFKDMQTESEVHLDKGWDVANISVQQGKQYKDNSEEVYKQTLYKAEEYKCDQCNKRRIYSSSIGYKGKRMWTSYICSAVLDY
jgi:hypothetical protein